jgi:hypothetical protein
MKDKQELEELQKNFWSPSEMALEHSNDIAGVLNLAWSLVKERGAMEFQLMLPRLFLHNKDSKAKEVESGLVRAVQNSHPSDFLDALQPFADSNDENVSKTSLDFMTRILICAEDGEIKKCIAPISEMLTTTVNSSSSEVMKATVLCFVAAMTQPHQKLINVLPTCSNLLSPLENQKIEFLIC